jgi:hypothetical protein
MAKMTRAERPLAGAAEASEILGVKQTNLRKLVGLPEPLQVLAMGSVWLREDIEEFADRRAANPARSGPAKRLKLAA